MRLRHELITGELLPDKLIDRLVGVQRADYVVAIAVSVSAWFVFGGVAFTVGIAGGVQPMTAPAFAVVRRRQQPIDKTFVGAVGPIGHELSDLRRRRRQAREIETNAAQQRQPVGRRRKRQACVLEPGQHERVDRRAYEMTVPYVWNIWRGDGLKRPVVEFFLGEEIPVTDIIGLGPQRRCAGVDPAANQGDFVGREFGVAGRHVAVGDALEKVTGFGVLRHDRLARLATGDH